MIRNVFLHTRLVLVAAAMMGLAFAPATGQAPAARLAPPTAPPPAPGPTLVVDGANPAAGDQNPGTADRPLKTLAKALDLAKGGDTILLGTGDYPAVAIGKTYEKPLTIRAAKGARPVMLGGVSITRGGGVRLAGLTFTWPAGGRPTNPMTPFIHIDGSKDVEISGCEIFDDPNLNQWVGTAASIGNSERVTIRDSNAHNFYYGFSLYRCKDATLRNLDIRMWSYEDGARVTECEGPVLIEGCHITNSGKPGAKGGHVDGIQSVYWNENVTIRNCHIHGLGQAIGAFGPGKDGRRLKNWRVEGCLIYDTYAPHVCSIYQCDGVTVVNNTFPDNRPMLAGSTNAVVKNNIIGLGMGAAKEMAADYNLWITGAKIGEHDLTGDAKFVNAPLFMLKSDPNAATRSKITLRGPLQGRLAVGDTVEVMVMDGSARDAKPRKVTDAIEIDLPPIGNRGGAQGGAPRKGSVITFDPPLAGDPGSAPVFVYKWSADAKDLVSDFRLKADSPAIDSADASVKRGKDRDGHEATDVPGVENTGAGDVKYLDRGAFEHVPAK